MKNEIIALLRANGELTLTAIQEKLGAKHKPVVSYHLQGLMDKGIIRKTQNKTYRLVDFDGLPVNTIETILIPRIIAKAGPNDVILENNVSTGKIDVSETSYKPEDLIMVQVSGDSMTPTFNDGDLLLFRKTSERPKNNEIVLWRVDDGAKIKRIKWATTDDGEFYGLLLSDNVSDPDNRPIRIDDANSEFMGKFISKIN